MKTKLLTLSLFGLMTFSFLSCAEEEVAPSNDPAATEESYCECEGGLTERDRGLGLR